MKKYLLKSFALLAMLFSTLSMSAATYCGEKVQSTIDNQTVSIGVTIVKVDNALRVSFDSENISGIRNGGTFQGWGNGVWVDQTDAVQNFTQGWTQNGTTWTKDFAFSTYPTSGVGRIYCLFDLVNAGAPSVAGFTLTDIDLFNTCGEEPESEETIIADTYFAPNWQEETNSTATYDAETGAITVDLKSQFYGQWQAQVKVKHEVDFSADKYYQFSAKFRANTAVDGVTIKVDDNNGMIFEDASVNLPANEDFTYTSAIVKGVPGNNKIIVFDFGYASPCQIAISDILLQEVEKPADTEKPVLHSATLVEGSVTHNSAVLAVSATDNVELAGFRVVDAPNNYDKTFAPIDGKITLTDLTPSTAYNFVVTALDASDNESENSISVSCSTIALLYCDFPTGHQNNADYGDANGRCLLSVTKLNDTKVRVTLKPNYDNGSTKKIDYLYVISSGGTPYPAEAGADVTEGGYDELSVDITYSNTPANYSFTILWSNVADGGRWQIGLENIAPTTLCSAPSDEEAPVMVSASLVSVTHNSAVLSVSATDNDAVADYHVVDATNNYDETIAPVGDKITLTDLTPSTTYNFTVTAVDLAGNESANNKTIVVTTDDLVYCDFPTGHLNDADYGDANGRCLLTLTKLGNTQIRITVKPNYDNGATQKLDFLYVVAGGANPNPATVGDPKLSEGGVDALSVDINYQTLTYPIGSIEIKWSTIGMDGEWATTVTNILESNLCLPIIVDENTDPATLPNGATCDVQFAREMTVANDIWNTIALPFGMNAEQIARTFGEGTLVAKLQRSSSVASLEEMKLRFDYVDEIEAGTPYIILPMESGKDVVISGVTINTTPNPIVANQVTMYPVLKTISYNYDDGDPIKFFLAADGYLHYNEASNQIKGLRAYFTFDNVTTIAQASKVRARIVFDENTETSVDNITMDEVPVKVIQHGQLIIIRNGVKYNVQGQKL